MPQKEKLYRSRQDKIFAGVCGGLGEYFDVEPLIFRVVFLILILGGGSGLLIYILLAIVIPKESGEVGPVNREEKIKEAAHEFADRARGFAEEVKTELHKRDNWPHQGHERLSLFGFVLVFVGAALLLNRFFPTGWFRWDLFWPGLLILLGVVLIVKKK